MCSPFDLQVGDWSYRIQNTHTSPQSISITVTSRAAKPNVPPLTVNAHMNVDTNSYPSPMVIYAEVSQGFLPVLGANVIATVEPQSGQATDVTLLDNGADPDITKNDGIYSRYFISFNGNGRYNLKVRVEGRNTTSRLGRRQSRALYVPGYVENGEIKMNAPRPEVTDADIQANLGSFSRIASGGSFVVAGAPPAGSVIPDTFPPSRITDLQAQLENDTIYLSWTAPGGNYDVGTAAGYKIKMSENPLELRNTFDAAISVNPSGLTPSVAGDEESFEFQPEDFTIENGTTVYFAIRAFDEVNNEAQVSNIARAVKFVPPKDSDPVAPELSLL
uniref:Uncharacterized protein n=1 Tax=Sphenodon punctatus TaxID=8508 RepID=A0A8D0GNN3_SPHPU